MVTELEKIKMMFWHFVLHAKKPHGGITYIAKEFNAEYVLTSEYSDQKSFAVLPTQLRDRKYKDLGILLTSKYSHPINLIKDRLIPTPYPEKYSDNFIPELKKALIEANEQGLLEFDIHIQIAGDTFTFLGLNLKENT